MKADPVLIPSLYSTKQIKKQMKILKKVALVLLIALVVIQFIRPDRNLSEEPYDSIFLEETNPSEEVLATLRSSCYDCHSNHTVYPWYFNVAPVSFWIADHVEHGKGHFNVSDWDSYDMGKKDHKLEEVVEMVESTEMPLNEYTWTHKEARLTEDQRLALIEWAEKTRLLYQLGRRPE